ncbi:LysR family transcriptional regulator [Labrenzia sp. 011]|uniref:LysR family transcriptional regulator n=1 Tax=Labrenzia sp. 011 TaxID=2171494 RepID=UPI000D5164DA|nr:LysR family transcriptional regulator [Labrenzia sp. 011]PVB63442.1 LysR family transcriptional regulator [Labrenzia sp. 011]
MSFDLKALELFVRAAELGAIGRAGEELGHSSTHASHLLKSLEKHLGASMFHRTTRTVTLTSDGEVFLDHAQRILQSIEEASQALADDDRPLHGTLRVGAPTGFARSHLIPFVPEFVALHPELTLDLRLSDKVLDMVEQGYDLTFRIADLQPSSLLARKVSSYPVLLAATPAYLEKHGEPKTPAELERHVCLHLTGLDHYLLSGPDGTIHRVPVKAPVICDYVEALAHWMLADLGIAPVSPFRVRQELETGALVPVMTDYIFAEQARIWAMRPPGAIMPRRVKVFLDFMHKRIGALHTRAMDESAALWWSPEVLERIRNR